MLVPGLSVLVIFVPKFSSFGQGLVRDNKHNYESHWKYLGVGVEPILIPPKFHIRRLSSWCVVVTTGIVKTKGLEP